MMTSIEELEKEIEKLKERNVRVDADKAWEVSGFRIFSIAIITYIAAAGFLALIGVGVYFLSALVPVLGYLLSVQSLPLVKKWWIGNFLKKLDIITGNKAGSPAELQ